VTERRSGRAAPGTRSIRRFTLEQRIRYDYSGPVTDLRQYLRVVPPARHGAQRRRAWSLTVEGGGAAKVWSRLDAFANLTTTIDVPRVGGSIEFVVAVDAETDADRTGRPPTIAGAGPYLAPTRLTAADGRIAALGSGGDPAAICARVRGALTYEWGITGGTPPRSAPSTAGGACARTTPTSCWPPAARPESPPATSRAT
jgi:hypothetical protein